jgi:hypothetical protein
MFTHFLRSRQIRIAIVAAFSLLAILPIWIVRYPPLIDYPNHLARAFVLHHLNDPHYDFGQFYAPDWRPNPYCFADFLAQVFQQFTNIYATGRLLLTLCILGLPLSVAFFLSRANPGSEYLALWAFAVAYNPNFLMGFMSFELSVGLCFVVVGVWLDYMHTSQEKYWVLTIVLATVLYLTHLGGFTVAGLALIVYTALAFGIGRRLVKAAVVFAPGVSLFLCERNHGWADRRLVYTKWTLLSKVNGMVVPFREYSHLVEYTTLIAVLLTIGYFLRRWTKLRIQYVWIVLVGAIIAVHWSTPNTYGDLAFVDYRFCIFAFLFALAIPVFRGSRTLPVLLASAVFLLHVFEASTHFTSQQEHLSTLAGDFRYIPHNSLVLAYTSISSGAPWEEQNDLHFWAYGVIERGWITPSLFHQSGVQPLLLRVPMYSDDDQSGYKLQRGIYDPDLVARSYDYLWATNVHYLDPYLKRIADQIVSQDELQIFKSREGPQRTARATMTALQGVP